MQFGAVTRAAGRIIVGSAFLVGLVLLAARPAAAQQVDGETVYRQNCAACHQIAGGGITGTFPPLVGNERVADLDYLITAVTDGKQGEILVNGTSYNGVMPAFGGSLTSDEIEAVAIYVQNELGSTTSATTLPPIAITPVAEDALIGERLFLGQEQLAAGGPACAACHPAGEHGDLVGVNASFGPDLTDAWSRLGGAGGVVDAIRVHPGGVAAVYADEPLTADEIGAVAAFLEIAGDRQASTVLDGLVLISVVALGLLLAATALVAANRREARR